MQKIALITGGASGIGRAFGEALAARGVTVVLADRQIELAREVAASITANGGRAEAKELDVRDASAFVVLAKDVANRHGGIHYLFNNAGIGYGGVVADYDRGAWDDVLDVNVRGVAYGIQAVYPIMLRQGSGHIINTASMAGLIPTPGLASYGASKHAVVGLSKALRIEAAPKGVKVSVLCPGFIQTPILTGGAFGRRLGKQLSKEMQERMASRLNAMDVNAFAKAALKDIDRNEPYIIHPRWWRALWLVQRVAPKLSLWLSARGFRRGQAKIEAHGVDAEAPPTPGPGVHA